MWTSALFVTNTRGDCKFVMLIRAVAVIFIFGREELVIILIQRGGKCNYAK